MHSVRCWDDPGPSISFHEILIYSRLRVFAVFFPCPALLGKARMTLCLGLHRTLVHGITLLLGVRRLIEFVGRPRFRRLGFGGGV
jgi:hypothetical protein